MTSVRLFIGWRSDGCKPNIECVAEDCRHLGIEAKSGDDGALFLQLSVRPDASPVSAEREDVHGAEEVPVHQPVYHAFTAFSQVDKDNFYRFISHNQLPVSYRQGYQQIREPVGKGAA